MLKALGPSVLPSLPATPGARQTVSPAAPAKAISSSAPEALWGEARRTGTEPWFRPSLITTQAERARPRKSREAIRTPIFEWKPVHRATAVLLARLYLPLPPRGIGGSAQQGKGVSTPPPSRPTPTPNLSLLSCTFPLHFLSFSWAGAARVPSCLDRPSA